MRILTVRFVEQAENTLSEGNGASFLHFLSFQIRLDHISFRTGTLAIGPTRLMWALWGIDRSIVMATRGHVIGFVGRSFLSVATFAMLIGMTCSVVHGQGGQGTTTTENINLSVNGGNGLNNGINIVGGVSIDAEGLLNNATTDALGALKQLRMKNMEKVSGEVAQTTNTRKISLRRLEETVAECVRNKQPLPDAIRYLAGLQHIEYVFVYPEQQDIVLVGPGEGWTLDAKGAVVGVTTHRPVMLFDDLLVALRSAQNAAQGGISCSIDPTAEGLAKWKDYLAKQKTFSQAVAANVEKMLGLQNITVNGVLADSHFANVLVAADYRMKRIAMDFEPSPVRGLPSYLQMVPATTRSLQSPRFWLEPQYEALLRDADGLAWNLHGASVKALTEEDFLTATGELKHSGKAIPAAQKWADLMTAKYPELAAADSIFGELQNCMELAVVGALVAKERLTEKAGNSLPTLMASADLKAEQYAVPKKVQSKASVLKKGQNWVISASGGVAINSWAIADSAKPSDAVASARAKVVPADSKHWWWD